MSLLRNVFSVLVISSLPFVCLAQLCQGSLGDPVVKIDFNSGPNPGQALTSTSYTYVSSNCPLDGNYTIANSIGNCFGGNWHALAEDHTLNDINGYMMVVNASVQPGDFYVKQVDNLCENTNYEFAAWMLSLIKTTACSNPIAPNVSFKIETLTGQVLMQYQTGDIPSSSTALWKQYGSYFTLPTGITSVKIRMTNNAPGGCGNDLVLDDITFRACGPTIRTFIDDVEIPDVDVCEGTTKAFKLSAVISSLYATPKFVWQKSADDINWTDVPNSDNTQIIVPLSPAVGGRYSYRILVAESANFGSVNCRVASTVMHINVHPLPVAACSNNGPLCNSDALILSASGGSQYLWQGPNNFTSSLQNPTIPNISAANAGTYTVAVSSFNCTSTASTTVVLKPALAADAGLDQSVCSGSSVVLNASGGDSYLWTPATGLSNPNIFNPAASPLATTTYTVMVSRQGLCSASDQITVNVNQPAASDAGKDFRILKGQSVQLEGKVSGSNVSYTWSPANYLDDPFKLNPIATPPYDIIYTLTAISNEGCASATDQAAVRVFDNVSIPNTFTPNSDGVNDFWNIYPVEEFKNLSLKVYNRYGNLVYTCAGVFKSWNGKFQNRDLPTGAYYYVLNLGEKEFKILKGSVTIVR